MRCPDLKKLYNTELSISRVRTEPALRCVVEDVVDCSATILAGGNAKN